MKDDEDYPTADPHLKTTPDMKACCSALLFICVALFCSR
jgi:hypothetical protein